MTTSRGSLDPTYHTPPGYVYDAQGRYRDARGRFVAYRTILDLLDVNESASVVITERLSLALTNGAIPGPAWLVAMHNQLRRLHVQNAALGAGGLGSIPSSVWHNIDTTLRAEVVRLTRFGEQILAGDLSDAQIKNRVRMYSGTARIEYYLARPKPRVGRDQMVIERRILRPAEHCDWCVYLAEEMGWQKYGILPVPGQSSTAWEDGQCLSNDRCDLEYRIVTRARGEYLLSLTPDFQNTPYFEKARKSVEIFLPTTSSHRNIWDALNPSGMATWKTWREEDHPRVPAGAPDGTGGQFAPAENPYLNPPLFALPGQTDDNDPDTLPRYVIEGMSEENRQMLDRYNATVEQEERISDIVDGNFSFLELVEKHPDLDGFDVAAYMFYNSRAPKELWELNANDELSAIFGLRSRDFNEGAFASFGNGSSFYTMPREVAERLDDDTFLRWILESEEYSNPSKEITQRLGDMYLDSETGNPASNVSNKKQMRELAMERRDFSHYVNDKGYRGIVGDEAADALDQLSQNIRYGRVEGYKTDNPLAEAVREWNAQSDRHEMNTVRLNVAAAQEFADVGTSLSWFHQEGRFDIEVLSKDPAVPDLRIVLRDMYDRTQEKLRGLGIQHALVYRGISVDESGDWLAVGDTVQYDENSLSSWTVDLATARTFAEMKSGAVVMAVVPANRILSTSATGFGQSTEAEVVLLGRPDSNFGFVTYSHPDENAYYDPDAGSQEIEERKKEISSYLASSAKSATVKGGPGSGHFGHDGRPGERGGSQPSDFEPKSESDSGENVTQNPMRANAANFRHIEPFWDGTPHEPPPGRLTKATYGKMAEDLAVDILTEMFGTHFFPLNDGKNNAPFDLAGDHKAVEVKAGLASNRKDAQKWRSTIGEPGKQEKAFLKTMSRSEKAAHNKWKADEVLRRKRDLLETMEEEAGAPIEPLTMAMILKPDLSGAEVFLIPKFHLTLRWSRFATEQYHVGTFSLGGDSQKSIKGGPGSGHFGHSGRPGERGGSLPGDGVGTPGEEIDVTPAAETGDRRSNPLLGEWYALFDEAWESVFMPIYKGEVSELSPLEQQFRKINDEKNGVLSLNGDEALSLAQMGGWEPAYAKEFGDDIIYRIFQQSPSWIRDNIDGIYRIDPMLKRLMFRDSAYAFSLNNWGLNSRWEMNIIGNAGEALITPEELRQFVAEGVVPERAVYEWIEMVTENQAQWFARVFSADQLPAQSLEEREPAWGRVAAALPTVDELNQAKWNKITTRGGTGRAFFRITGRDGREYFGKILQGQNADEALADEVATKIGKTMGVPVAGGAALDPKMIKQINKSYDEKHSLWVAEYLNGASYQEHLSQTPHVGDPSVLARIMLFDYFVGYTDRSSRNLFIEKNPDGTEGLVAIDHGRAFWHPEVVRDRGFDYAILSDNMVGYPTDWRDIDWVVDAGEKALDAHRNDPYFAKVNPRAIPNMEKSLADLRKVRDMKDKSKFIMWDQLFRALERRADERMAEL